MCCVQLTDDTGHTRSTSLRCHAFVVNMMYVGVYVLVSSCMFVIFSKLLHCFVSPVPCYVNYVHRAPMPNSNRLRWCVYMHAPQHKLFAVVDHIITDVWNVFGFSLKNIWNINVLRTTQLGFVIYDQYNVFHGPDNLSCGS